MSKKIGVILSGCGYLDGAEIQESVLTLLAIDREGAEAVCMAPNIEQMHVVNHISQEEMPERRNVLVEASRIVRGQIQDIKTISASDLDALILPGGFGAAKNLSNFALEGSNCTVQADVLPLLRDFLKSNKPIGVICIAPAVMAKVAQEAGDRITLTIGSDAETAAAFEEMGVQHIKSPVDEIVIDKTHKIVSSPAYMLPDRISKIEEGISKLVHAVIEMIE
ncbi:MAG: isoprenoid biosynthesis glyoxalase ElbB [Nitrospirae bacterium]|nr:isoprenoid biosynthesis glyoxalase ElbB [Candidatus Manganitrophaceae bacterium]